jgi:membrane protein required for colicin V production
MHYLDVIILVIILACGVEGGIRGFVYELCSLIGLLAGLVLGWRFFPVIAGYIKFLNLPDWILNITSFLLIMIVVSAILRMLGGVLRGALRKVFMGWLDHAMGVIFGLARGFVLVLLITLLLMLTPLSDVLNAEASKTRFLKHSVQIVSPFLNTLITNRIPSPDSV